jgi:hypothetical protein
MQYISAHTCPFFIAIKVKNISYAASKYSFLTIFFLAQYGINNGVILTTNKLRGVVYEPVADHKFATKQKARLLPGFAF